MNRSRRIERMTMLALALLTIFVLSGQGVVGWLFQQSSTELIAAMERGRAANASVVQLTALQKDIKLHVVQVQQFLTDVSATRGLDGLGDGFDLAAENAAAFEDDLAQLRSMAATLGAPALESAAAGLETAFGPYYELGQKMARAYVAEGPQAGNALMGEFDGKAAAMSAAVDATNRSVARLVEASAQAIAAEEVSSAGRERRALIVAIVAALGTALFAVGMNLVLRGGLLKPLGQATEALHRLAGGDMSAELSGVDRRDEMGDLARAFAAFKAAAHEKERLEAEAAERRAEAEATRGREAAAARRAAEEQALVVREIGSGLAELSAGNLGHRITAVFPGDYERLRRDFNEAMDELQATMRTISGATDAMHSGSGEISQAADDLSRRTEQQAASLEEAAAALDQITATVRRTAEGAVHGRDVAAAARSDAEASGRIVEEAVTAMTEIEGSSRQVSQIIGVIDEIAFQTNLLALNAGVEAARAGEAGKGFAVVAQEVRALAQRSAEAAKEIKSLIATSSGQVEHGVDLVGRTGEALGRIVRQVAEVSEIVETIAASAREQSTGLGEVNVAVNQMDQVTQQNAAMVEETTAASHSLSDKAEELSRLVARFRLEGGAPARAHNEDVEYALSA